MLVHLFFRERTLEENFISAILYKKNFNKKVKLGLDEANKLLFKGVFSTLIDIELEGKKHLSLVKEIQRHPVTGKIVHIDFLLLEGTDRVKVPIEIIAENIAKCEGIKLGGTLLVNKRIKANFLAKDIKKELKIDISGLKKGYSIFSNEYPELGLKKITPLITIKEG